MAKLSTRILYWLIVCTLVGFIVFASLYTCIDLASKHVMYVKTKQRPRYRGSYISNTSFAHEHTLREDVDVKDILASKGLSDDEVDYELSSFTKDKEDEDVNDDSHSAEDDEDENDHASVLDNLDDFSVEVSSNSSFRYYDPELYINLYRNRTTNSKGSMKITDSPSIIFIMAQWRFGSSVFGELFNQNSNLFYLFEPLFPTIQMRKTKGISLYSPENQQMSRDILRKLSRCRFDADWVKMINAWGGKMNNKAMCRASFKGCSLTSAVWMREICRIRYKGQVAAKVIRANLETLKPLIVDDKINLKIIHLVRDPRGSAISRINYRLKLSNQAALSRRLPSQSWKLGRLKQLGLLNSPTGSSETVQGMCKWIRENAIVSPDLLPDWLKDRYYLVRYEDFADSPLKVTKELYKFTGIPFPQEVQRWVLGNTRVPKSSGGVFSTRKNSHVAATHWMNDLTKIEIDQVEEECMDVLKLMGYDTYNQLIIRDNS